MSRVAAYKIPQHIIDREVAKRGDRVIQAFCLLLAVGCLAGAGLLAPRINHTRRENQFAINPENLGQLSAEMELLSKAGMFRALAIDAMFIRMERLKQENKYYELMQLSNWLCKLAPRFPTVWYYAAWNQAYNVSVAQYTPEARWKWVHNGIKLLRDEGIQINPKAISLYKELAWLYLHKIGDFTDDYHFDYKEELAVEMERVLGAPPPVLNSQEVVDAFRQIAQAPRDVEALLRDDPQVAALAIQLREVGLAPDDSLLEFVARNLRNDLQVAGLLKIDELDARQKQLLDRTRLLTDPAVVPVRDRLLAALRSRILRKRYYMDPAFMLELMETYGPIDWRSPYGQSLYWSTYGDKVTKTQISLNPSDSMNTVRFIFFSLDNMVKRGRLILEPNFDKPNDSFIQLQPDSRFIRPLQDAFLKYGREQKDTPDIGPCDYPILDNYRAGHVNFLRSAIQQLWLEGTESDRRDAREYYKWLREHDREWNCDPKPQYLAPIETLVEADIGEAITSFKTAGMLVNTFLQRYVEELAAGNLEYAEGRLGQARELWNRYMADKTFDVLDRRQLPPFDTMRTEMISTYIQSSATPVLKKVALWENLTRTLELPARQALYDDLLPYMTRLCDTHVPPLDRARAFREPPGMEEYRKTAPKKEPASQPVEISPGEKPNR